MSRDPKQAQAAAAQNYMEQADIAAILWDEMHLRGYASYPLMPVPPHPGKCPPRWRWRERRRWVRAKSARVRAKEWNFGALYGRNVSQVQDCIVFVDVAEARQMLCDYYHTQTQAGAVE